MSDHDAHAPLALNGVRAGAPVAGSATTPAEQSFARRALIAVGVAGAVAALALFLWYAMDVLLLAFAAVLVSVLLRGSAEWVAGWLNVGVGWALGLLLITVAGVLLLGGYFAAPPIVRQVENLVDRLPQSLRQAEETLRQYPWGRRILGDRPDAADDSTTRPSTQATDRPDPQHPPLVARIVDGGAGSRLLMQATRIANSLLQGLLTLFVILVSGIYLAAQPRVYVNGLLML